MDTPVAPLGTRGIKKRPPKVAHPEDFAEDAPFTELPPTPVVVKKTPNEEFIDLLTSCTLKAFHEADVEITNTSDSAFVVLYFPEVIIRNTSGDQHTIKDTYIKLSFYLQKEQKYRLYDVGIRRGTYTYAEYQSSYIHSHVSGSTSTMLTHYNSSICLGSTSIASQKSLLNAKFDASTYVNYLWLLKNWMCWESKEGTPYRYIGKITITRSLPIIDFYLNARQVIQRLFREHALPDLKINSIYLNDRLDQIRDSVSGIFDGEFVKVNNQNLENAIKPFTDLVGTYKENRFELIANAPISKTTIDQINRTAIPFKFKDKTITPKIDYTGIEDSQKPIDKSMLKVHPSLVDAVAYELDELLNKLIDEEF